ncbi:hypothetical protein CPB86DRAFT_788559, partial [Serendipita vermifera]
MKIENKAIREIRTISKEMITNPHKYFDLIGMSDPRTKNKEAILALHKCPINPPTRNRPNRHLHSTAQLPEASSDLPSIRQLVSLIAQQQQTNHQLMQQTINAYTTNTTTTQAAASHTAAVDAVAATDDFSEIAEADIEMVDVTEAEADETEDTNASNDNGNNDQDDDEEDSQGEVQEDV